MELKKKRSLIFGMGAGRCGTTSLAWLLNEQRDAMVTHEMFPVIPWATGDSSAIQFRWEQLHHQSHNATYAGDVATSYLPWINFLMDSWSQVPHLRNEFNFKFIVMKRDIEEIVQSFLLKFERQNNNPLQDHGDQARKNEWDACFPKYGASLSLEEALQKYCTDYYNQAELLEIRHRESVKIFDVESLNTEDGVRSILDFSGISNPRIVTAIKKNSS